METQQEPNDAPVADAPEGTQPSAPKRGQRRGPGRRASRPPLDAAADASATASPAPEQSAGQETADTPKRRAPRKKPVRVESAEAPKPQISGDLPAESADFAPQVFSETPAEGDDDGQARRTRGPRRGRGPQQRRGPRKEAGEGSEDTQRLHKVLAQTGLGSRREMESLIADGKVEVNGETAHVGQTITPKDRVHVKRRKVNTQFTDDKPRVLLYHKPPGEIVSRDDPEGRPTVFDGIKAPDHGKWVAVGRLDFNSEGLLLFTTYGELANRLMHPRYEIVREYSVRVLGELTHEQEDQLIDGIELEDGPARVLTLDVEGGEGANRWYRLTLQEGRNREVRRMFEALGLTVSRLIRTRYGSLAMPSWLKRGQTKLLDETETFALLTEVGLRSNSVRAQMKRARKGQSTPAPQIGVMRNAREHELMRDGRSGEDPAQRTARGNQRKRNGKPRVDALATSFGFGDTGGGRFGAGRGQGFGGGGGGNGSGPRGNNAGGNQNKNKRRKGPPRGPGGEVNGNVAAPTPRHGGGQGQQQRRQNNNAGNANANGSGSGSGNGNGNGNNRSRRNNRRGRGPRPQQGGLPPGMPTDE